jgi:hypothetical protein
MTKYERSQGGSAKVHFGYAISLANDCKAFQCLADASMKVLTSFPTTTRQDEQELQGLQERSPHHRRDCHKLAIQYRSQYKRSVACAHKVARACLSAVKGMQASIR